MAGSVGKGVLKGAAIISAFALVGKLFGFVQKQVMAHYFGTGAEADAFTFAFGSIVFYICLFPQQLLSPFMPLFVEKREKEGEAAAWRLAGSVGTLLVVSLVLVVIGGYFLAPSIVAWTSKFKNADTITLSIQLIRFMMPTILFMGLSALLALLLNAYRNFAMPALGDTINKVVMIGGLVLLYGALGIFGLAAGVAAGAFSGLFIQGFALRRNLGAFRFGVDWSDPALKQLLVLMLPILFSAIVGWARTIIDSMFATDMAQGSLAGINYARGLTDTLILLVPTAVGVAIYPAFSDMNAVQDRGVLTDTLMRSLRLMLVIFIPVTVALVLLRFPLVQLAFQRGKFTGESVAMTVQPLTYYAFGLAACALEIILMKFYFSMKNTLVPALVGAFCVLVHWGVILLFKDSLQNGSMALAATVSRTVKVVILFALLARVLPTLQLGKNGVFLLKTLLAAAGMAAVMILVLKASAGYLDRETGGKMMRLLFLAVKMGLAGGAGVAAFALVAHTLRMEEAQAVLAFVKRRRKP